MCFAITFSRSLTRRSEMITGRDCLAVKEEMISIMEISPCIDKYIHNISERLQEAHQNARYSSDPRKAFMDEAIKLSGSIIQIGVSLINFRLAIKRSKELFPRSDYLMVFCIVVLGEIANRHLNIFSVSPVMHIPSKLWEEISRWIQKTEIKDED